MHIAIIPLPLVRLKNSVAQLSFHLANDFNNPATSRLFFKGLVLFTLVKVVGLISFSRTVMAYHEITLPRSLGGKMLLAPAFLANENIDIFYVAAILFLIVALVVKPNYFTTILFFWLTFNLYIINLPFANGADLVLFMLALWCIPISTWPRLVSEPASTIQKAVHNAGIILCQLQLVFIYLVSGWDKLISEMWRSGQAFDYIIHLDTLYNPVFAGAFDNPFLQLILSWTTILFELTFVILVWIERSRLLMLTAGVFFHLFIWIVISLPDFASVMIVSYIIFLKDKDYHQLRKLWAKR